MKNSEHERELDDPQGFREAGYISAGDRIRNKANNLANYYIKSRGFKGGENMGRRVPRDVGRTNIVVDTNIGLRSEEAEKVFPSQLDEEEEVFQHPHGERPVSCGPVGKCHWYGSPERQSLKSTMQN